jgi:hypothetical protein
MSGKRQQKFRAFCTFEWSLRFCTGMTFFPPLGVLTKKVHKIVRRKGKEEHQAEMLRNTVHNQGEIPLLSFSCLFCRLRISNI